MECIVPAMQKGDRWKNQKQPVEARRIATNIAKVAGLCAHTEKSLSTKVAS
jgi:hypothetical protein